MKLEDFDYHLPEELIAQTPLEPRDSSRLMIVDKTSGAIDHYRFHQIDQFLHSGMFWCLTAPGSSRQD
jgi:S-adenosylmethionine:tRNA ribosyltransferase-isomerase